MTPVCDIDGAVRVSPAECPVIAPPAVSAFVIRPSMATSPAGPKILSPELSHGVQLHDPCLLEYVGAPESARLTSRSPEYWVHHMGREKALSAALQLQHDVGLILSNVQVLQQLETALNRTSSDMLRSAAISS